uniref:Uncharacterized protein n=1 Tax=Setaria italica TaxID=4555 RepID=K3ZLX3_SETIT
MRRTTAADAMLELKETLVNCMLTIVVTSRAGIGITVTYQYLYMYVLRFTSSILSLFVGSFAGVSKV